MRVMALDWGMRRIGIAVSDELGIAAHGLPTLERKNIQRDLDALTGVIRDRGIETVVVGNPPSPRWNGEPVVQAREPLCTALGKACRGQCAPLGRTTHELGGAGELIPTSSGNRGATDRMAAILLLESYLAASKA